MRSRTATALGAAPAGMRRQRRRLRRWATAAASAVVVAFALVGSAYPDSPDAVIVTESKLTAAAGQAGDAFGTSVSIDGGTAIVGAPLDDTSAGANAGSASVFVRSGGTWSLQQELTAPDGAAGDEFGSSVAVSGDTVIVGARSDTTTKPFAGSAYVFVRTGTTWSLQQKLTATGEGGYDRFGYSVALDGDTALVGAFADNTGAGVDAGSAYVFVRVAGTWSQQQKLTAGDGQTSALFGSSVALRGDTAFVGAYAQDGTAGADQGAEYVFTRSGTTWTQHQKLVPSGAEPSQFFGFASGFDGTTLVVGAPGDDSGAGADTGLAYVFTSDAGTWTERQALAESTLVAGDQLGTGVGVDGLRLVAGAAVADTPGGTDAGAVSSFTLVGGTWTAETTLRASDGAAGDHLGISADVSGDTALSGANSDDTSAGADAGSAYAFRIQTGGVTCSRSGTTLTIDIPAGQSVTIGRSGSNFNVVATGVSDPTCGGATVDNIDTVIVNGAIATELVQLDLSGGAFAPGATPETTGVSEIEFQINLGDGSDSVNVLGSAVNDRFVLGVLGINANTDTDADWTLSGVESATVNGALGDDIVSAKGASGTGGPFPLPLSVNGGDGNDKLTGGAAPDTVNGEVGNDTMTALKTADGADVFNGGLGTDTMSYGLRTAGVKVTLDGLANDGGSGGAEGDNVSAEKLTGGTAGDTLDATAAGVANNTLSGGNGNDSLLGGAGKDTLTGGNGNDGLQGGDGDDKLNTVDGVAGNDTADGGNGTDTCTVDPGDIVLNCP